MNQMVFVYSEPESLRTGVVTLTLEMRSFENAIWKAGQKKCYTLKDLQSLKHACTPVALFEKALKSEMTFKKLSGQLPSQNDDITKIRLTQDIAFSFLESACKENLVCLKTGQPIRIDPRVVKLCLKKTPLSQHVSIEPDILTHPPLSILPVLFESPPLFFIHASHIYALHTCLTKKLLHSIPEHATPQEVETLISRLAHYKDGFVFPDCKDHKPDILPPPPIYPVIKFNRHFNFAHLLFEYPHHFFISEQSTDTHIHIREMNLIYQRNKEEELLYTFFFTQTLKWPKSVNKGLGDYYVPLETLESDLVEIENEGIKILHENKTLVRAKNISSKTDHTDHHILLKIFTRHDGKTIPITPDMLQQNNRLNVIQVGQESILLPKESISLFYELKFNFNASTQQYVFDRHDYHFLRNIPAVKNEIKSLSVAGIPDRCKNLSVNENDFPFLRPYQMDGLKWLLSLFQHHFSCLLADEMGLGKTIQVLCFLSLLKSQNPKLKVLVLVPKTLLWQWSHEIMKFTPDLTHFIYHGTGRESAELNNPYNLIITTYHLARQEATELNKFHWDILVLDEAHHIKNPAAHISVAIKSIKASYRIALTGTPVMNHLQDVWSLFEFMHPGRFPDKNEFLGHEASPEAVHVIQKKISPFILRRTKLKVALELPQKQIIELLCPFNPDQEEVYQSTLKSTHKMIQNEGEHIHSKRFQILEKILRLRQIACHPSLALTDSTLSFSSGKTERILETMDALITAEKKILIFSQFTKHLRLIKAFTPQDITTFYLDGSTKHREEEITKFKQYPKPCVFFLSLKAFGMGLNLTEASDVLLLDPWWNAAVENQAIDRTHRIGQTQPVTVYRFITKNSIEEKVQIMNANKQHLSSALFDAHTHVSTALSMTDLLQLIEPCDVS